MNDSEKERNLDDFIKELKNSSEQLLAKQARNNNMYGKFEYEQQNSHPDLFSKIETLKIESEHQAKLLQSLEENQKTFSEHLSELTSIVADAPQQISKDVVQKVEHFLEYFTDKIENRITTNEKQMEHERKLLINELDKRSSKIPNTAHHASSVYSGLENKALHTAQEHATLEWIRDTNLAIKNLTEKIQKNESQVPEKIKPNDTLKISIPQWLHYLNIIFLGGIFIFLAHHFFSNYTIQLKQSNNLSSPVITPPESSKDDNNSAITHVELMPTRRAAVATTYAKEKNNNLDTPSLSSVSPDAMSSSLLDSNDIQETSLTANTNAQQSVYIGSDE